ncbi:COG1361 family protein [Microscilla marina]|uniref:Extracellular protease, putative n=1 Tax=Microscilla marina ATCC 23134 TaxID=313606 RepID=A1ZU26_MICM2|nr:hypothetical protein [Microscilla marina]EAY26139.1 extracellular protease, putative [Microscilla marina ATCC 23134]
MKSYLYILWVSVGMFACTSSSQTNHKQLTVTLVPEKTTYAVGEDIRLKMVVKNNADKPYKFCKWHTPFEGFRSNCLSISEVDYQGLLAKRSTPEADDYQTLKSGASTEVSFTLDKSYPITKPGTYDIQFKGNSINQLPSSATVTITVK